MEKVRISNKYLRNSISCIAKFRYSEEAIKIGKNLPLCFDVTKQLSNSNKRWDIFFKFFLAFSQYLKFMHHPTLSIFAEKLSLRQRFDQRFGDGRALCLGNEL